MSMPTPIPNPANSVFSREIGGTPVHVISQANTNPTVVKAAPGTVIGIACMNAGAVVGWLHLHDTASAPTAGSTPVVQCYAVPASTFGNGFILDVPITFSSGIAFTFTGGAADNDSSAAPAGVALNIIYR
jgi:hypothetical protein